jgi:hypothetical protein
MLVRHPIGPNPNTMNRCLFCVFSPASLVLLFVPLVAQYGYLRFSSERNLLHRVPKAIACAQKFELTSQLIMSFSREYLAHE